MKDQLRRRLRKWLGIVAPVPPAVTFRTIMVCFSDRTLTIDGRKITTISDCLTIPILNGDAIFVEGHGWERVA